jgi:hypothetical protein
MTQKQIKAFDALKRQGLTPVLISGEKIGTDYTMPTEEGLECSFQRVISTEKVGVIIQGESIALTDSDFFRISK